jgi:hypothetical protein
MATETRMFNCVKCKMEVVVDVPAIEILNGKLQSIILYSHPKPEICNHCGQGYLFALNKNEPVTAVFGWVPVTIAEEKSSGIVMPPGGFNMKTIQ